jgi:hypothetical protein
MVAVMSQELLKDLHAALKHAQEAIYWHDATLFQDETGTIVWQRLADAISDAETAMREGDR